MTENAISLKEYVDRRFNDADRAIQAALVSQEKAIIKAEASAERRFELLNELRQGVATTDQLEAQEKVIQSLTDRVTTIESLARGSQLNKSAIYAGLAALGTLVVLANYLFK
jgi:hypothetical protein